MVLKDSLKKKDKFQKNLDIGNNIKILFTKFF